MFTTQKQKSSQKDAVIAARIPRTLKELISRIVRIDAHINESDFLRDALREKVKRDAPELYKKLFQREASSYES